MYVSFLLLMRSKLIYDVCILNFDNVDKNGELIVWEDF